MTSKTFSHSIGNDFHPDMWLLPCLMASLWFRAKGQRAAMVAVAAIALLAKEDVSVILSGYALFLMIRREERAWGFALLVIALGAFAFHVGYFIPKFIESKHTTLLAGRYHFLGDSFSDMALNLVRKPDVWLKALLYHPVKYVTFAMHMFPVGWLTVLSPTFLLPPVISAMPHILSQASTQLDLVDIYALPFLPFIFVGAAASWRKHHAGRFLSQRGIVVAVACLIAGIGVMTSPRSFRSETRQRRSAFAALKKMVPPSASVAAQQNLYPHFDTREIVGLFPNECTAPELQRRRWSHPDYVIADRLGNPSPFPRELRDASITSMETNPDYEKVFDEQNFMLFRLKPGVSGQWINCR
jgi:uncharacterized membrane protein